MKENKHHFISAHLFSFCIIKNYFMVHNMSKIGACIQGGDGGPGKST